MKIVPLDASLIEAWRVLFVACGSLCFCRYWHFVGTKNDWLERCALSPETSFDEHAAGVRNGDETAGGLVAMNGDVALGWMKLTPRGAVPKLRALPVYRSLDLGPGENVFAIGCLLVHPEKRRSGIASALVAAAETEARAQRATALEAYPRHTSEPLHDEEAWMGPERMYLARGFERVAGETAYPVYRKLLRTEGGTLLQ